MKLSPLRYSQKLRFIKSLILSQLELKGEEVYQNKLAELIGYGNNLSQGVPRKAIEELLTEGKITKSGSRFRFNFDRKAKEEAEPKKDTIFLESLFKMKGEERQSECQRRILAVLENQPEGLKTTDLAKNIGIFNIGGAVYDQKSTFQVAVQALLSANLISRKTVANEKGSSDIYIYSLQKYAFVNAPEVTQAPLQEGKTILVREDKQEPVITDRIELLAKAFGVQVEFLKTVQSFTISLPEIGGVIEFRDNL